MTLLLPKLLLLKTAGLSRRRSRTPLALVVITGLLASPFMGYSNTARAATSSGPVQPDAVAGLQFWFKADALALSDNDPVGSWVDSSGNGITATQADSAKRPIYKAHQINGLPVVRLDGSNDFLQFARLTNIRSVFVVMKHATGSQDYAPILGDATNFHWVGGTAQQVLDPLNASTNILSGSAYVNGQSETPVHVLKPTSFRLLEFVGIGNTTAQYITNDVNTVNRYLNADIAEIFAYSTAVSAGDRQGLEQYLINKYGSAISETAVLRSNSVFVGDSLTAAGAFAERVINCIVGDCSNPDPVTNKGWFSTTYATAGYTLEEMSAFDASVASVRNPARIRQAVVLWGGGNDIYKGASVSTIQQRFQDRISVYKAAGYGVTRAPIVIPTILPRSNTGTPGNYEVDRITINQWLRDNAVALGIVIADIAANTTIGDAGDETNTTYYSDLAHLTAAGYDVVAPIIGTATRGVTIRVAQGTNTLAALDSVTFARGPFALANSNNFSSDQRTRIIFFTTDLGFAQVSQPNINTLSVRVGGNSYAVESVGPDYTTSGSFIVFRLPDLSPNKTYPLGIRLNGVNSTNTPDVTIVASQSGSAAAEFDEICRFPTTLNLDWGNLQRVVSD